MARKKIATKSDDMSPSMFAGTSPTSSPAPMTERSVNQSADEAWSKLSRAVHMQLDTALAGQADLSPQAVIATLKFVEASREVAKAKQTSVERFASLTLPVFDDDGDEPILNPIRKK